MKKGDKEGDKAMHGGGWYVSEKRFKSEINCFMGLLITKDMPQILPFSRQLVFLQSLLVLLSP